MATSTALATGALLVAAAILGKLACAVAVVSGRVDRFAVAIGMIPCGDVGLIFAAIGAGLTLNGEPLLVGGDRRHGRRYDIGDATGTAVAVYGT